MKLRKSDFKAIVKECLVEILQEGLLGAPLMERAQPAAAPRNAPRSLMAEAQAASRPKPTPGLTPQAREIIKQQAGGNRVMEEIFAHTATTTLPNMINGDRPSLAQDPVSRFVDSVEPEQIFGEEMASKWADLAFMGSPPKSRE